MNIMTANAFTSVSLSSPLVLVCIDHDSRTLPLLHARKRFGVNVLAQNQRAIAKHYARTENDDDDAPRPGVRFTQTEAVAPMLEGCFAYLNSRVVSAQEAGDHTIFAGEAEQVVVCEGEPLLFYAGKYRTIGAELPREQ